MNTNLSTFYRRLQYLQEWINLSVDNRVQRQLFEDMLWSCGIAPDRFPPEGECIYQDFEGYCTCREAATRHYLDQFCRN